MSANIIVRNNATMTLGESDDDYHSSEGLSASGIKLFDEAPIRYWAKYLHPDPDVEEDEEEKEHFTIGKAGHCFVCEPGRFETDFAEMPGGIDKRTKEGKAFWKEFQETHNGAKILKQKSMKVVRGCGESILKHPTGKLIRSGIGIAECSIRWKCAGLIKKIRPDFMIPPCDLFPNGLIIDLKFMLDISPEFFRKEASKRGYFIQAAHYQDGYMEFYGTSEPPPFLFLCAEKKYPWVVQQYSATQEFIDLGRSIIKRRIPEFIQCLSVDVWPAYSNGETLPLQPTDWLIKKEMSHEFQ